MAWRACSAHACRWPARYAIWGSRRSIACPSPSSGSRSLRCADLFPEKDAMITRVRNYLFTAALASLVSLPTYAQAPKPPPAPTPDAIAVRKLLEERFPGGQVKYIAKSPYFGLYEVMYDETMMYVDPKVNYVFVGNIFDTKTRTNVTERKARELNRVAFGDLPLNLAMVKVKDRKSTRLNSSHLVISYAVFCL